MTQCRGVEADGRGNCLYILIRSHPPRIGEITGHRPVLPGSGIQPFATATGLGSDLMI